MSYQKDNSLQTMDYASLIWRTNMSIMESITFGNTAPIPDLVQFLETILTPYRDKKFMTDIQKISELKPARGNTPNEVSENAYNLNSKKVMLTHRALLELAYRKKFLPATGSHQSNEDYIVGGQNE